MNTEPDVSKILEVRKNLKAVKSKFRHKLADKKDLEEVCDTIVKTIRISCIMTRRTVIINLLKYFNFIPDCFNDAVLLFSRMTRA